MDKPNGINNSSAHLLSEGIFHSRIEPTHPAVDVYQTLEFGTFPNTDITRQLKIPYQSDEKEPSVIMLNLFSDLLKVEGVEEVLKKYGVTWTNL